MSNLKLRDQLLVLIPADGSRITNRSLMALASRSLAITISSVDYFEALDDLSRECLIGRARGQGGSVFLLRPTPSAEITEDQSADSHAWTEARLMPSLEKYLTNQFWRNLDLPRNAAWKVWDTSTSGPSRGKWVRPDFTAISVLPLHVLPTPQLDVYSFELKPERSGDVSAVHEALAQTRTTNFGFLVWHLPHLSQLQWRLADVLDECVRHGIGLILIREPEDIETWEVPIDPLRKTIAPSDIDAFLNSRLSDAERTELRNRLKGKTSEN